MSSIPADGIEIVKSEPRDYAQIVFRVSRFSERPETDEQMKRKLIAKVANWLLEQTWAPS